MDISVIICTYNRSASLKKSLDSLCSMKVPEGVIWEIIIVDNNSHDDTRNVVAEFKKNSGLPVSYVIKTEQGTNFARNEGIKASKGNILLFTDDDVIVDIYWLDRCLCAFKVYDTACIGGQVLPLWEKPCPIWLTKELYHVVALLDLGNETVRLNKSTVWGNNMAFKASVFEKYGYFDTSIGRKGEKLFAGDETTFIDKLIKGGEYVYHCPDMKVNHYIPGFRIKKSYFRKWEYCQGEQFAKKMGHCEFSNIMGVPLYAIRAIGEGFFRYLWFSISLPSNAFREQLKVFHYLGFVIGRIKYRDGMPVEGVDTQ